MNFQRRNVEKGRNMLSFKQFKKHIHSTVVFKPGYTFRSPGSLWKLAMLHPTQITQTAAPALLSVSEKWDKWSSGPKTETIFGEENSPRSEDLLPSWAVTWERAGIYLVSDILARDTLHSISLYHILTSVWEESEGRKTWTLRNQIGYYICAGTWLGLTQWPGRDGRKHNVTLWCTECRGRCQRWIPKF